MKRAVFLVAFCLTSIVHAADENVLLDDFIKAPDPNYKYAVTDSFYSSGSTVYILQMQSQGWLDSATVSPSVWKHDMVVVVPKFQSTSTASLIIGGGSNSNEPLTRDDLVNDSNIQRAIQSAAATGSVVAVLNQVPNEPTQFAAEKDPKGNPVNRSEDAIIAYTLNQYLESDGSKTDWPALLPMTKSAVRAMDTVQSLVNNLPQSGGTNAVSDFVVLGGSKRGWTTWLTAAADDRVKAIMPLVYDNLNIQEQFKHHPDVYKDINTPGSYVVDSQGNKYSIALKDYIGYDLPLRFGDPGYKEALNLIDPYEYMDRYTDIPKYIVNSAGDEFFVIDSSRYYYDQLPGDKWLRYVPNTGHGSVGTDDVAEGYLAYFDAIAHNQPLPHYTFNISDNGENITAHLDTLPDEVHLWLAYNPLEPDFRHAIYGDIWQEQSLSLIDYLGDGTFSTGFLTPQSGWIAYFMEFVHYTSSGLRFTYTTGISVIGNKPTSDVFASNIDSKTAAVPEVSSFVMAGFGLACFAMFAKKRFRKAA
ncbi:PhoPQ-activated pathogenicity-related family protein [bacterium]|nr:PhoPQ-activated pathogenicity-related family protein [bacterium]